jgi:hypothetical protein
MAGEATSAKKDVQVKIQVPDDMIRGRFADQAEIRFHERPFVHECHMTFFASSGDEGSDYRYGPVVLLPENAKRLAAALRQNLGRYAKRFGGGATVASDAEGPALQAPATSRLEQDDDPPRLYANLVMVNHRPGEFTVDFIYSPPNPPFARVVLRAIVPAALARAFGDALDTAVARYEETHGLILLSQPTPPGTIVH